MVDLTHIAHLSRPTSALIRLLMGSRQVAVAHGSALGLSFLGLFGRIVRPIIDPISGSTIKSRSAQPLTPVDEDEDVDDVDVDDEDLDADDTADSCTDDSDISNDDDVDSGDTDLDDDSDDIQDDSPSDDSDDFPDDDVDDGPTDEDTDDVDEDDDDDDDDGGGGGDDDDEDDGCDDATQPPKGKLGTLYGWRKNGVKPNVICAIRKGAL